MNNILDSQIEIRKLDKSNVLGSVEALPDQCQHAWEEANKLEVPEAFKNIESVVMAGMGGSGLGARLIESVFANQLRVPLVRINDYDLPGFVNDKSLVICSSYSGATEETVENAKQAISKRAKWMAIGTGGILIELAKEHSAPYFQIDPVYNPSNQPRMAIGYSVVGQLALANKADLIGLSSKDIQEAIETMRKTQAKLRQGVETNNNPAKKLAKKMYGKMIEYIAARHLIGAAHTVKNQLNENAKTLASLHNIPELNHHLMEGLRYPKTNRKNVFVFFVQSDLYPEKIQQRIRLTKQVVEKNGIISGIWEPKSNSKLSQAFELIQFGAYVNFYLSMLYGLDPAPIPWVDYFKKELTKI